MSQKRVPTSEKQKPVPMEEPLKKHGDKMDVGRLGGAEKEDGSNPIGGARFAAPNLPCAIITSKSL